ncbi:MAG: replication initiation protein [Desulfovibrio sp.]|uniref:replication initiation protein n=1 Tax=Desulfovibrio sp. 7SRBS1 TaxID=3378064 RepID=UPI003B3E42E8
MNKQHKDIAVKSNALINSFFSLGLQEMRLFAFTASKIPQTGELPTEPIKIELSVREFADTFGIDKDWAYKNFKKLAKELKAKNIEVEDDKIESGVSLVERWVRKKSSPGVYIFHIAEPLVPHLLALRKGNFTPYRIKYVYNFKRFTTWRVYELLKQHKNLKKRKFDLDEFRKKVGVHGKYNKFFNLRARVIDTAIKEINESSDIKVDVDYIKKEKAVVGLVFHITENTHNIGIKEKIKKAADRMTKNSPYKRELYDKLRKLSGMRGPKQLVEICKRWYGHEAECEQLLQDLLRRYADKPEGEIKKIVYKVLRYDEMPGQMKLTDVTDKK